MSQTFGMDPSWYLIFKNPPLTYSKEKQVKEALKKVKDKNLLKTEDPNKLRKLLGIDWLISDLDILDFYIKRKKMLDAGKYESNLHQFNWKIEVEKRKEKKDQDSVEYWKHVEIIYGKFKEKRLQKEAKKRLRRAYSEGNLTNSLVFFDDKSQLHLPPYPYEINEKRKVEKREKKKRY